MNASAIPDLLALDAVRLELERAASASTAATGGRVLFVSLNPDLKTDFGHFLNYERRLQECCERAGYDYACFAHADVSVSLPGLQPVFAFDSGHYSLTRQGAAESWRAITEDFCRAVGSGLAALRARQTYDRVVLFLYCGSSMLASRIADEPWPHDTELVVNAFWDFLQPQKLGYGHVSRLSFQQRVRLLAMSGLHGDEIFRATGLKFDSIPNPPPLLDDLQTVDELRAYGGVVPGSRPSGFTVLVPGLMTLGKGKDCTEALYRHVCAAPPPGIRFLFRDRAGVLDAVPHPSVKVLRGDLQDNEVKDAFRRSDAALLPYDASTFRVRTSGALVDCLCFGTIPLVMKGTWLADACERHDFGRVLDDMAPERVLQALSALRAERDEERHRLLRGASRYLSHHTWRELFGLVVGTAPVASFETRSPCLASRPSESLLAESNRLIRAGDYQTAALLLDWLSRSSELSLYRQNLEICVRRSGMSADQLLARDP